LILWSNFENLGAKLKSVTKIEWESLNKTKVANSIEYPCFQKISGIVPEKFGNLIFWVQNQFQRLTLSGNDAQYIEIGLT